jgi:hypothetical protein
MYRESMNAELKRLEKMLDNTSCNETATAPISGSAVTKSSTDSVENAQLQGQFNHLQNLLDFVCNYFALQQERFKELFASNEIRFDLLWLLYHSGESILFQDPQSELNVAGQVSLFVKLVY